MVDASLIFVCRTVYSSADLRGIADQLPSSFKDALSTELMKKFKYNFHSASYHFLIGVVTAMRTVVGHLVQVIADRNHENMQVKAVKDFILELYEDSNKQDNELFYEFGLRISDPNPDHIQCLTELPLTATYSCLKLFIHWVEEGFYDFNTLPFRFKAVLSSDDAISLQQLQEKWSGTPTDLMKELEGFIDVLKHSEQGITTQPDDAVCR